MSKTITYQGRTQTLAEWAAETGINFETLRYRIQRGMPVEEALTRPVRVWQKRAPGAKKRSPKPPECCVPDCEHCPLPDCEYNGAMTVEESAWLHKAHTRLPDVSYGMLIGHIPDTSRGM